MIEFFFGGGRGGLSVSLHFTLFPIFFVGYNFFYIYQMFYIFFIFVSLSLFFLHFPNFVFSIQLLHLLNFLHFFHIRLRKYLPNFFFGKLSMLHHFYIYFFSKKTFQIFVSRPPIFFSKHFHVPHNFFYPFPNFFFSINNF